MQKAPAVTPKKPNPPKPVLERRSTMPVGLVKKIPVIAGTQTISPQAMGAKTTPPR
jgi:hypothetical protein